MPLVLPPEWSPRLPSELGTRPPPGLATENDLYDNNRSVSSGFVRFHQVSFGFVEKGNPLYLISRSRLMPALTVTLTLPTATDPATDPNRFATDVNPNPGNASPSLIR